MRNRVRRHHKISCIWQKSGTAHKAVPQGLYAFSIFYEILVMNYNHKIFSNYNA